jgi:hypothetical protein
VIQNRGSSAEKVSIFDAYSCQTQTELLQPQQTVTYVSQLQASFGWYDLTAGVASDANFQRRLTGHVETGRPGVTDPAIAGGVPQALEVIYKLQKRSNAVGRKTKPGFRQANQLEAGHFICTRVSSLGLCAGTPQRPPNRSDIT